MIGVIVSVLVIVWVVYAMIIKKYRAHAVLFLAGFMLLAASLALNLGPLLPAKDATGIAWLDMFKTVTNLLQNRTGTTGMVIMAIAGFGSYMDYLGASKAMFAILGAPLKKIRSPYVLLVAAFFLTQILVLFIPSHSGLGLLLMATMYPVLIRVGVSKMSAIAVIACCQFVDHGPGSQAEIYAAQVCGLDPATYFVNYQLPITIPIILAVAITHFFVQRWWDKKEGFVPGQALEEIEEIDEENRPPLIYALLPIVPFGLIMGFSPIFKSPIKMDVISAMLISLFISLVFEYVRLRDANAVMESLMVFFKGMGKSFVTVISMIVAGETFAAGLLKIGTVDTLIKAAQDAGLGVHFMVVVMSLLMALSAFLLGSGNATFFSFAPIAPRVAQYLNIDIVTLLLPMQIMTSFGRVVCPIAAPIIAIAGVAGVSTFQIIKRTAIPMLVAAIVNIAANFIVFLK
ncbi:DcuC family C4-dicarboxylate transporter [Sporomusaceae bacterium BoRhaA]|uniref:C4-dicarboxylate transporter DcuC n=1 Tax=Pelorhabdus rhamnosifermentans TaxID=2772457 RepID=UPI001FE2F14A|nr:C4-dicarboxylate transporter DcuC [Pelorhabdus rhamnosifermentans]MBU2703299.1 DcuC family C4-dicarboxylate transporter [Pelorhabdus rhamnosifermentans]